LRRPFIAGNWKMNLHRGEAVELAHALANASLPDGVDVAVCPPSVYLDAVREALSNSGIGLGAQNFYEKPNGAFTGEISGSMLVDLGCRYVIVGHSERRQFFDETDASVLRKAQAALALGLTPIVCLGESLQERKAGDTQKTVARQFEGSLAELSEDAMAQVVIAYEPIWAIGTGEVATPEQAQEVHADLRRLLRTRYNDALAEKVRIQYGGSVKPENAAELLRQPDIDGALVGGASLKADSFLGIVAAAE
jgi:triosephosphate isomerase (TIM)